MPQSTQLDGHKYSRRLVVSRRAGHTNGRAYNNLRDASFDISSEMCLGRGKKSNVGSVIVRKDSKRLSVIEIG